MYNHGDAKRRPCKFTTAWCHFKEFSSWLLPVVSQSQKAYCLLCKRCFSVGHSGLHDVKAHCRGKKHCQLQEQDLEKSGVDSYERYDVKAYSLIYDEEQNCIISIDNHCEPDELNYDGLQSAFENDDFLTTDAEEEETDTMVKSNTGTQQYCLRWKYHHSNLQVMFIQLLQRESFCDVTLACEGKMLRAHKVVLSACSTYFDKIFSEHEEKDPVVILKDVKFVDIKALVEFMYKGEINVENSHLNSLLKTAEELKIKGLADASGKGLPEDDDSITYAPAPPRSETERRNDRMERNERKNNQRQEKEEDYDQMIDSSLLENSVSIHDGSDIEEGTYGHDENEYMESSNENNFSTLISHLQDYRTADEYASERDNSQREHAQQQKILQDNPILSQFSDVIKMNDYLTTGRRQQFWEEPFTRRLMEAIKNKEIEMKAAAELMGVSYGTLYGRYRDAYGCLKHPYRTKDFWAEQGPAEILARLHKKEITLFRAAEMLNVTVTTLANYLATLRFEKQQTDAVKSENDAVKSEYDAVKSEHEEDEEMDVNESMEAFLNEPVPSKPKIHKSGSVNMNAEDEFSHPAGVRVGTSDDEY